MAMVRPPPPPDLLRQVPARIDRTTMLNRLAQRQEMVPATDEAYPLRDGRFHQLVVQSRFAVHPAPDDGLVRPLRVAGVLVPVAAADALGPRSDYVRLGLPAYVRALFRNTISLRGSLSDPLYADADADADTGADGVWWVRAWPTDALATAVAADGTVVQHHDAAALLRQTGQGFTVTADLLFDYFLGRERSRHAPLVSHGVIVTVLRSVITGLYDPRPEPVRRPGVDEHSPGCHLATPWNTPAGVLIVSPDTVLAQLAQLAAGGDGLEDYGGAGWQDAPPPEYHVALGAGGGQQDLRRLS